MRGYLETAILRDAMLEKLGQNGHKGDWKRCSRAFLLYRILVEWFELVGAVLTLVYWEIKVDRCKDDRYSAKFEEAKKEVLREAGDVGNFAWMTADLCGSMEDK